MPFPLIPVVLGTAAGWAFGNTVEQKVRGFVSKVTGAVGASRTIALDADLPKDMRSDLENLLSRVKDPGVLEYAANYYKQQGFPAAANALSTRAAGFLKGATHG